MKKFDQLSIEQQELAVQNQHIVFRNLVYANDLEGVAGFFRCDLSDERVARVKEVIRLCDLAGEFPMAAERAEEALGDDLVTRALERAQKAFYREPGEVVVGAMDRLHERRPGTGRTKIRVEKVDREWTGIKRLGTTYGVYLDDQFLIGRIRCATRDPEVWVGEDAQGNIISPREYMNLYGKVMAEKVRSWMLRTMDERVERGEFDYLFEEESASQSV